MSTDKYGTELTPKRTLHEWMYAVPDGRNVVIEKLKAENAMLRAFLNAARAREFSTKRRKK